MGLWEVWNMLKSGNMPPPMPPDDENDPDSPGNDDTTMDTTRDWRRDASVCPACEKPIERSRFVTGLETAEDDIEGACQTLGCPLSPVRQWGPDMDDVLRRKPVQSGKVPPKLLGLPKNKPDNTESPIKKPAMNNRPMSPMITPRGVCHNCNQFAPIASNSLCYHCWKR